MQIVKLKSRITEILKKFTRGSQQHIGEDKRINKTEDRAIEMTLSDNKEKKRLKKNIQKPRDLGDNINGASTHIMIVQEEEREKGTENFLKKYWPKTSQI